MACCENHVVAGCALQSGVGACCRLAEDEILGVGGAKTVGDGKRDLVGRRRNRARIISDPVVQSRIEVSQQGGAGQGVSSRCFLTHHLSQRQ